jgi:hypothetical protein
VSTASFGRLGDLLRWIGLTLVVLLGLQLLVLLTGFNWSDEAYRQLVVQVLVTQAPMALVGLLLMLVGGRIDQPSGRTSLRIVVGVLSIVLAVAMVVAVPLSISGDRVLSEQTDQQLASGKGQLEQMRSQMATASPEALDQVVMQAEQAGQMPAQATAQQKRDLVRQLMAQQVKRVEDQLNQQQKARDLTVNQRRIGGTGTAVVMAIAFVLVALVALI